jgi:N-ethylmaleimide reductase
MAKDLFDPVQLGPYLLNNRAVMPPMTRSRSPGGVPNAMNVAYYAQRAGAGLIVVESTAISAEGLGWINSPGIYTPEQIAGWRQVTDAVHAAGGRIFMQLWHAGRCSHVSVQPNGQAPVAPSAIPSRARSNTPLGRLEHSPPRALETEEIPRLIADYCIAARNAMQAGFDGVEVHAANGYLLDQFLRESTNHRSDAYGGSPERRVRLICEVVSAVCGVYGRERVGLRISPTNPYGDMADSDPATLYATLVAGLNEIGPAYLHMVEGSTDPNAVQAPFDYRKLSAQFEGLIIANNGYTLERARSALAEGHADLISFGRLYVANPDLVERLRAGGPFNPLNTADLYQGAARGYVDYPTLAQARAQQPAAS